MTLRRIVFIIVFALGIVMTTKAISSLSHPQGVLLHKIFVLFFFAVLTMLSFYYFYNPRQTLSFYVPPKTKSEFLAGAFGSLIFVIGAIFVMVLQKSISIMPMICVLFFGLCFLAAINRFFSRK